jgi:hypothetical protein
MQNSDDRDSKRSVKDEIASASAPYDMDTFANELHRTSKGMISFKSSDLNAFGNKLSKLAEIAASDELINDFVVTKHTGIVNVPFAESLSSMLKKMANSCVCQPFETNARPIHPFDPRKVRYESQITGYGMGYVYGNFARYSCKEVSTCMNNAFQKISEECIYSGKASTCLISSLVCGLYYEIDSARIKYGKQQVEVQRGEQEKYKIGEGGKIYRAYGEQYEADADGRFYRVEYKRAA